MNRSIYRYLKIYSKDAETRKISLPLANDNSMVQNVSAEKNLIQDGMVSYDRQKFGEATGISSYQVQMRSEQVLDD